MDGGEDEDGSAAPGAGGRPGAGGAPGAGGVADPDAPGEALARDLLEYGRGRIASFKLPRHVLFVENLPMTSSGKVRKAELRALAAARLGGQAASSP